MTEEWWRIQLILNSISKHNKFATSPASARVKIRSQTSVLFLFSVFLKYFS